MESAMHALDQELEDVFVVGQSYSSYICCGEFIFQEDIHKSLPWLQKSVRSLTFYFPGTLTNWNKEIVDFLLDASWKCVSSKVKLEWVSSMEGFVKTLVKKFRTITTIKNALPLIWFSSRKNQGERRQLNYLLLDPGVTKLEPRDSHNAETAYIVSNGRNRMQIGIFKRLDFEKEREIYDNHYDKDVQKLNISADSWKSDDVYNVVIKFSTIEGPMSSRKQVEIIDDSWIETLKFLSFAKWSKAIFVSRQISGLVQRNVTRLPCIVIDSATVCWAFELNLMRRHIIAFGAKFLSEEFFTDLGISLDAPAEVQHENAIIKQNEVTVKHSIGNSFEMSIELAGHRVADETIFFAHFGQSLTYSWAAIKYFLEFLYHPASYVKEVRMFAINQKLIDACFGGAERFIRCRYFLWKGVIVTMTADDFSESLTWLEKNIRAETILFPRDIEFIDQFHDRISIFLLNSSWKCARNEVKFVWISDMNRFLEALLEKFRSVSFVRNDSPTFMAVGCGDAKPLRCLLSGPDVKKQKSSNSRAAVVYIISNGNNRMRIRILKHPNFEEKDVPNYQHSHGDSTKGKKDCVMDVFVKVYHV